jgi:hypothetical protein
VRRLWQTADHASSQASPRRILATALDSQLADIEASGDRAAMCRVMDLVGEIHVADPHAREPLLEVT